MRSLITLIIIITSFYCTAQTRFAIKAGGNISTLSQFRSNKKIDGNKAGAGYHITGVFEYMIDKNWSVMPELMYSTTNAQTETGPVKTGDNKTETTTYVSQIQVPINLKYRFGTDESKIYVLAGTYIGYGLASTKKNKTAGEITDLYSTPQGANRAYRNRWDSGAGLGFGIEINHFTVGAEYQIGIANLNNTPNDKDRLSTFRLALGWIL